MSLERTALRWAVVSALANNFTEPYPTLARDLVYDSRLEPLQNLQKDDAVPMVVVYTEDDAGEELSKNNGGPPFRHRVTLNIDISVGQVGADGTFASLSYPQTDAELEAALDAMEHQIRYVLSGTRQNVWTRELCRVATQFSNWSSSPWRHQEGNVRLAARTISVQAELPHQPNIVTPLGVGEVLPDDDDPLPEPLAGLVATIRSLDIAAEKDPDANPIAVQAELLRAASLPDKNVGIAMLTAVRMFESDKGGGNLLANDEARPDGVAEAKLDI